jgi:hypothetical protein
METKSFTTPTNQALSPIFGCAEQTVSLSGSSCRRYLKGTPKPPAPDLDIPATLQNYPGFYLDIEISNEFTKNPVIYRGAVIHYKMMGIHPMETQIKIVK